jgi:peptidyl-prolyl cis-trans isomerase A (cyclophilin A)
VHRSMLVVLVSTVVLTMVLTACDKKAEPASGAAPGAAKAAESQAKGGDSKKAAAPEKQAAQAAPAKKVEPKNKPELKIERVSPNEIPTEILAMDRKAMATSKTIKDLKDPSKATLQAPPSYKAKFETTAGIFTVQVTRASAPNGADRFFNLVKLHYYDGVAFFRVIPGFMAQFGLHGDPDINKIWRAARITDDPVVKSNTRGMLTFATAGPNTRTTQLFINFQNNQRLDGMGFASFGQVTEGMDIVDKLHSGYGEGAPRGRGPDQGRIQREGNNYLRSEFPNLDYIKRISIM